MGIRTELFASGSPRKRYDKARKAEPGVLISMDVRDGRNVQNWLATLPEIDGQDEALKAFLDLWDIPDDANI